MIYIFFIKSTPTTSDQYISRKRVEDPKLLFKRWQHQSSSNFCPIFKHWPII